jgi:hypothetical protein
MRKFVKQIKSESNVRPRKKEISGNLWSDYWIGYKVCSQNNANREDAQGDGRKLFPFGASGALCNQAEFSFLLLQVLGTSRGNQRSVGLHFVVHESKPAEISTASVDNLLAYEMICVIRFLVTAVKHVELFFTAERELVGSVGKENKQIVCSVVKSYSEIIIHYPTRYFRNISQVCEKLTHL